MINLYNKDCLEAMKEMPDNKYDLAIVDPPYGLGMDGTLGKAKKKTKGFNFTAKEYIKKGWDKYPPSKEYFDEVFRVSKNQIIWGANYFSNYLPIIKNYVFWYKKGLSVDSKFNEGEMAYVSRGRTKMFDFWWNGFGVINNGEKRTHPTQKPVKLYEWLLMNYAKEGDRILDTHGGSMSSVIACINKGFGIDCYEVDLDYYNEAKKRILNHVKQLDMFIERPKMFFH